MENIRKKSVISMSGGLDSTCLALSLLSEGYEVKASAISPTQSYVFGRNQMHTL